MEYKDLPKLWGQLLTLTYENIEKNIWEDFQLARTNIKFDALYDNRKEGDILLSPTTINFYSTLTFVISGTNYKDILDFFPDYYRNDPLKNAWLKSLEQLFNSFDYNYNFYSTQMIIDRATLFLYLFANDFGVLSIPTLSYSQRRNRVLAKAFINQPFTPKNLVKVLELLEMTGVNYEEETGNYLIILYPNNLSNTENFNLLNKILQIWKPAHIEVKISISMLTWQDLEVYTWENLETYSWAW
jgi:hypothetical protein